MNGNQELAKLLADARTQIKGSGDDAGPLNTIVASFTTLMEAQQNQFKNQLTEFEKKISDSLADQVVEGQKKLRNEVMRKGGWGTLDNAEVYARLIDPAGLTMEQKLTMPSSQLSKYVAPQEFERIKIFQELNDDAVILGWIMATKNNKGGGLLRNFDIKDHLQETRTWKALQSVCKSLSTGGSATGAEWMPTQFSSQLVDMITVSLKVASNFARINIPANTFKIPIATSDDVAFLVAETNSDNLLDDANSYPKFTPATGNVTFNAKKLAAIVVFSEEAEEDSIIPLLAFIRGKIANAMSNAQERATLDGDTTATHMDFDVTAATDARKAWMGMRLRAKTTWSNTTDLATFNLDNIRDMRSQLTAAFAENPESLFYVTSVKVMLKLLKFPEFMTIDKYGDRATIVTGEIGRIDGSPLQTSKYSRDDVASTGVNTTGGPNTKSLLYLQNRLGFMYGDRREIKIDSARMIISGQGYMVISQRLDFKDIHPSATYEHGALGINI